MQALGLLLSLHCCLQSFKVLRGIMLQALVITSAKTTTVAATPAKNIVGNLFLRTFRFGMSLRIVE